jgi:Protein of unknown function (DUF3037)
MTEKRQFEVVVLKLLPHVLRDECMNVGVVLVEIGGDFAEARFTRDFKRLQCFAPNLDLEVLEYLESAIQAQLKESRRSELIQRLLDERFGDLFDVGSVKGLVAEDPAAEMRILERDLLAPMQRAEQVRQSGRMAIVEKMADGFANAGVLEMLMRNIDMTEFTGAEDRFRVDFGYRVGKTLKMFEALALGSGRDPALALAYRYSRIQTGVRKKWGDEALLTAVISEDAMRSTGEAASGIAMLRANEVEVRSVREIGEIAKDAKRELRA